jgi:RHS repeat-associated protein
VTTWVYDTIYQLVSEWRSTPGALDWNDFTLAQWQSFQLDSTTGNYFLGRTRDPNGNCLIEIEDSGDVFASYDAANQLETRGPTGSTTNYVFDQAGNQQLVKAPGSQTTTFSWDDENRNTLVQLPNGQVDTFVYNGDGLRFQKQDSLGTTRFVWDGMAYLAETDGNNVLQAEFTQEPGQFGGLVSQRRLASGLWVLSYHQYDGLGSTNQLTDDNANITDVYLYQAFGTQLLDYTGATLNPFQWVGAAGYYFDPDTANCYVRARFYLPNVERWGSQDPIGFDSGDDNPYRYVLNNPTNWIDPSGLQIFLRPTPIIVRPAPYPGTLPIPGPGWYFDPMEGPFQTPQSTPSQTPQPAPEKCEPKKRCQDEFPGRPLCKDKGEDRYPTGIARGFLEGELDIIGKFNLDIRCYPIGGHNPPSCPNRDGTTYHCSFTLARQPYKNRPDQVIGAPDFQGYIVSVACCSCCDANGSTGQYCQRPHWSERSKRPE